jgi:hypothetical protein
MQKGLLVYTDTVISTSIGATGGMGGFYRYPKTKRATSSKQATACLPSWLLIKKRFSNFIENQAFS